jgi:hypothetical protein
MELNEELTVALPCDSGRLRPELVGLLLHPISRSETWRSLSFFQALRVLPALRDPRTLLKKSGRRAELEEKSGVRQQGNYTGNEVFSQGGKIGLFPAIPCHFSGLRMVFVGSWRPVSGLTQAVNGRTANQPGRVLLPWIAHPNFHPAL